MLYNEDRKRQFLNEQEYDVTTERRLLSVFNRISIYEELKNKAISEFDMKELEDVFYSFKCKTYLSMRGVASMVRQYIKWEIQNGYLPSKNVLIDLPQFTGNRLRVFMNTRGIEHSYLRSRDELYQFVSHLENPRDQAIVCLLYEGVCGEDYCELRDLKKQDCNFDLNEIVIRDKETAEVKRIVKCDERTMQMVRDAIETDEYATKNGEATGKRDIINLIPSDYVIRVSRGTGISNRTTYPLLFERFRKPDWGVDYYCQYFTPTTIRDSGIFNAVYDLECRENREITEQELNDILTYYGKNAKSVLNYMCKYKDYKKYLKPAKIS